jgi:hypothetical protein
MNSRKVRWAGNVDEKCIQHLIRKSEGKTPHWRARIRWEDNIKMEFKEVGYEGVKWILLA